MLVDSVGRLAISMVDVHNARCVYCWLSLVIQLAKFISFWLTHFSFLAIIDSQRFDFTNGIFKFIVIIMQKFSAHHIATCSKIVQDLSSHQNYTVLSEKTHTHTYYTRIHSGSRSSSIPLCQYYFWLTSRAKTIEEICCL